MLELLDFRSGHFALESGHHGDQWMDLDLLFLRPAGLAPYVGQLGRRLAAHGVATICGPLTGGAFLAEMIASILGVEFCYAQRDTTTPGGAELYGARYRIPDGIRSMLAGRRVAIVDDVVNAGSAVGGTLADLRTVGAFPVVIGALLVLGDTAPIQARRNGVAFEALTSLPGRLWRPAECPLCAAGQPLEVPAGG